MAMNTILAKSSRAAQGAAAAATMQLAGPKTQPVLDEGALLLELLPLDGARVLDLGCGAADKSIQLLAEAPIETIVAAEVDRQQHRKNLERSRDPRLTFCSFGAEAIDAPAEAFDLVLMFKSLHHVPLEHLDRALNEVHRVLKPGGLAYVSEPVFAGAFNEVLRLFHDEQAVRLAAFDALQRAVSTGLFELVQEVHFYNRMTLDSFSQFENRVIKATHSEHRLSPECHAQVRQAFEANGSEHGYSFDVPNRIDLLRKRQQ